MTTEAQEPIVKLGSRIQLSEHVATVVAIHKDYIEAQVEGVRKPQRVPFRAVERAVLQKDEPVIERSE
jgi:hypothetical protein